MKKETITLVGETQRNHAINRVQELDLLNTGTRPWQITIARKVNKRTLDQNALMHKWFGEIAESTGDDPQSVKSDMKDAFSPRVLNKITEEERPMDTHEMSTVQMSEFMDRITAWAGPFGIYLTNPDDLGRDLSR